MEFLFILAAAFSAVCAAAACFFRYREARTLRRLDRMLSAAADGSFLEKDFDESMLSAVESRMYHYLSASAVSSRNLAEEKDKVKTLISDISHQTKTPLSNVLLYAELLGEQELSSQSRTYVDALNTQGKKLQFLIAALVKTSRLETGILAFHPRQTEAAPMLEHAVSAFLPRAEEKGICLRLMPGEASAFFDPKWTEEAVCNLIDNAVKYTPSGGSVTVSLLSYPLFCRIDVADTGPGIGEDMQSRIFSRFYRGREAADEEGVGIGLYLVRQIAAGQGGYVKVARRPGGGSIFSLFLPSCDGRDSRQEAVPF